MKTKDFKKLLDEHDWYYFNSHDSRAYDRGREREMRIKKLVEKDNKFKKLFNNKKRDVFGR